MPPSRPRRSTTALLGLALVAALTAACGGDALQIDDARSRMSPRMAGVGAVYLEVVNPTDLDDRLVGGRVDPSVAAEVELHETFAMDDGMADDGMGHDDGMAGDGMAGDDDGMAGDGMAMMGMREIAGLDIPAGATVSLVPGGHHLMLLGLTEDLVPGTTFMLTLLFEQAGELEVEVEVREDV